MVAVYVGVGRLYFVPKFIIVDLLRDAYSFRM